MSVLADRASGAGVLDRLQVLRSAPTPLRGAPAATWPPVSAHRRKAVTGCRPRPATLVAGHDYDENRPSRLHLSNARSWSEEWGPPPPIVVVCQTHQLLEVPTNLARISVVFLALAGAGQIWAGRVFKRSHAKRAEPVAVSRALAADGDVGRCQETRTNRSLLMVRRQRTVPSGQQGDTSTSTLSCSDLSRRHVSESLQCRQFRRMR